MRQTVSPCSTASWANLATLRKRGQRPLGLVYLSDEPSVRRGIERNYGLWALPLPVPEQCYLLAGLWAVMFAKRTEQTQDIAQRIAAAEPRHFTIGWKGERWDHVM